MARPRQRKRVELQEYSAAEERAHVLTHGLGVALGVAALVVLVSASWTRGDIWHVVSTAIYGTTLIILYGGSTLYHSARSPRWRHVAKVLDHCAIYLLIAGTYTPFSLVTLRGPWGWSLFGVVWGLALVGVAAEAWWVYRPKWLSTILYLALGWVALVAIKPLVAALSTGGFGWLLAGGVCYSLGTLFYVQKQTPYMHAVWHVFVLAGSVCHFVAVARYVVPA